MKTAIHVSRLVRAGIVLAALTAARAEAQDVAILQWGSPAVVVPGRVPENLIAIAGGGYHSLGLKSDGSIVAWGADDCGPCDVPAPNTGFVAVAGGWCHSLGLKSDGSIVAWGSDGTGQCNVPAPNTGFVAVAGGYDHSLGLKAFYGDLNCDGVADIDDINPFVDALSDPGFYQATYPRCHRLNADCNHDGAVTFDDVSPFVELLSQ